MAVRNIRPVKILKDKVLITIAGGDTAIVDLADLDLAQNHNWCYTESSPGNLYITAWNGHGKKRLYLHRVISKAKTGEFVDYKDGDVLNNRASNLEIVAHSSRQLAKWRSMVHTEVNPVKNINTWVPNYHNE